MGVNLKRKRGSPSFRPAMEVVMVMVALVLLINTNSCGASFVLKSNVTSYRQCITTGAMDGCLIADDLDLDFDFFMDTQVVRILGGTNEESKIEDTGIRTRLVCYHGYKGQQYSCDASTRPQERCRSQYNRNCFDEVPASSSFDGNGR